MKDKMLLTGILSLITGISFIFFENLLYQYVDENGMLNESLFMPLGALSILFGVLMLLIFMAKKAGSLIRKRTKKCKPRE